MNFYFYIYTIFTILLSELNMCIIMITLYTFPTYRNSEKVF